MLRLPILSNWSRLFRRFREPSAKPAKPVPKKIDRTRLDAHKEWLRSNGFRGKRLVLAGEDWRGADFSGNDLSKADLSGAGLEDTNLTGTKLVGADLTNTHIWDADLSDADLTDTKGLLKVPPETGIPPLSGAVLTGAKLPPAVADFPLLKSVEELSKNAGKLFLSLLGTWAFLLVIVLKTTDLQLILNQGATKIPLVEAEIAPTTLFVLGPAVLFVLYVSFHLYLQRLWEALSGLPAVFPDGLLMTQKVFPWLLHDLVSIGMPRLVERRRPLYWLLTFVFTFLAYWLVPISFCVFWARYLCRQDMWITSIHALFFGLFLWVMVVFTTLARMTWHRDAWAFTHWQIPLLQSGRRKVVMGLSLAFGVVLWTAFIWWVSFVCVRTGVPPAQWYPSDIAEEVEYSRGVTEDAAGQTSDLGWSARLWSMLQENVPRLVGNMTRFACIAECPKADFSVKPEKWIVTKPKLDKWIVTTVITSTLSPGKDIVTTTKPVTPESNENRQWTEKDRQAFYQSLEDARNLVRQPAHLSRQWLRFAYMPSAFLAFADLQDAEMTCAYLDNSDFRGAEMGRISLAWAKLIGANLSGANLTKANLNGAYLNSANLTEAVLESAYLNNAYLSGANLSGANLKETHLHGAHLTQVDLSGAHLIWTDLSDADLSDAHLEGADLNGVILTGANLNGAVYTSSTSPPYPEFFSEHPEMKFIPPHKPATTKPVQKTP